MDGQNPVLIIAETAGGVLRPVSLELVTAGRKIANLLDVPLVAQVSGAEVSEAARELSTTGVDKVFITEDPELAGYTAERMTAVAANAIEATHPAIILIPGTTAGRDYAPRLAARLQTGLAADSVDLDVEDGALIAVRPVLGGRVQTAVKLSGQPHMATIRPGVFEKAELGTGTATIEPVAVSLTPDDLRVHVRETVQAARGTAKLEEADIIVAGGRGLKEPDNYHLVEQLATALGAAIGSTRAIVDAGWRPHDEQIGQTGHTVAPHLYIAVGISGAVQHLVGMQGSDYVVAINHDPDAPIFKIASFGIVGDLFDVVPAVVQALGVRG